MNASEILLSGRELRHLTSDCYLNRHRMDNSYSPVQYVYREIIEEEITKHTRGKIFYFSSNNTVESFEGQIMELKEIPSKGLFIVTDSEFQIRVDRVITVFGKPAAAYDEYDNYANQCLSCTGGYDL